MNIEITILLAGIVLFLSVFTSKVMYRFGVPTLLIFISLGIILGSEGLGGIYFADYSLAGTIAQIALMVIIFSGGFDTSWKSAKSSAPLAITLSSVGVVLTAVFVGTFAHFVIGLSWLEGLLLGSIVSSTDAASVFSIFRSRNLNLKGNLASTLEVESGSNDPFAYMMTILFLSIIQGSSSGIGLMLLQQLAFGIAIGLAIGFLSVYFINHVNLAIDGLYIIIAIAVMMLSFGLASFVGGNGFLAVYLTGIVLGNRPLTHKISLIKFFDGLTWLMQILLFFTLGLLVFPSQVIGVFWQGLAIALFISFIGRPLAVFLIMTIFKRSLKEKALISWVGFRGAASIVFAIYPLMNALPSGELIFNIVFFVALFSVIVQGTFLVPFARKLGLTEDEGTVLKTFTDYRGDIYTDLLDMKIEHDSTAVGKKIRELKIPGEILIVMIKRGGKILTPRANTVIQANDILMLASDSKEELLSLKNI
jgi:cell volume regulation protein A